MLKQIPIALFTILLLGACAQRIEKSGKEIADRPENKSVRDQLLAIQDEYTSYHESGRPPGWKPAPCAAASPYRSGNDDYIISYGGDTVPRQLLKMQRSGSRDLATHGESLFYLFIKELGPYRRGGNQPFGQVIVKQTWKPRKVNKENRGNWVNLVEGKDGNWYRPGEQDALFIMYKTDEAETDTDDGWVYGIVHPFRKEVLEMGKLQNCMGCHQKNGKKRVFGLPPKTKSTK